MVSFISWFIFFQFLGGGQSVEQVVETKQEISVTEAEPVKQTRNSVTVYNDLKSNNENLPSLEVFQHAMRGYEKIRKEQEVREDVITVVDFSLPSTEKRMWVIDLENNKVLFHNLVAHGQGTGGNMAEKFSNIHESHQSSIGFFLTSELYTGKHGLSLRLDGLEEDFNDNARDRAIVMHGADYVSESFITSQGRLGRSFGCPAVPNEMNEDIVNTIAKKSVMFLYYPDYFYIKQSAFFNYALNESAEQFAENS